MIAGWPFWQRALPLACLILAGCARPPADPARAGAATPQRLSQTFSLTPAVHELGVLRTAEPCSRRSLLRNTGQEPLTITTIDTSCSCVTASSERLTIQPGESTFVEVTFDPQGSSGDVHFHADVYFDDPGVPIGMIELKGTVESAFGRRGGSLDLGRVEAFRPTRREVSIPCRLPPMAGEPTVESTAPHLTATARRDGDEVTVSLVVRDAPLGKLEELVRVRVGPEPGGTSALVVRGHVAAPYKLSAESVFFGFVPCADRPARRITIDGLRQRDVDRVAASQPGAAARLEYAARGGPATLVVELDPTASGTGLLDGLVTIELRRPRGAALRFRVVGSVLPDADRGC